MIAPSGQAHRVWLTDAVRETIADLSEGSESGWVFSEHGRAVTGLDVEPDRY